jgi:hypothetical protein
MRSGRENQPFWHVEPAAHPEDLLSRVIKRLGFEKELVLIKRHLKFFSMLFAVFLVLSIFAFIGVEHVLQESSFGPFLSLLFSDPGIIIKYWHSFMFAAFESVPGVTISALLFSIAFLMLFMRLIAVAIEKMFVTANSIKKQKYGNE